MVTDPDVLLLVKIGILSNNAFPATVGVAADTLIANQGIYPVLSPNLALTFSVTGEADLPGALDRFRKYLLAAQNDALAQNYLTLITAAGAFYAGLKAMELCDVFINAARTKKS
jgi:hypothetical protein